MVHDPHGSRRQPAKCRVMGKDEAADVLVLKVSIEAEHISLICCPSKVEGASS